MRSVRYFASALLLTTAFSACSSDPDLPDPDPAAQALATALAAGEFDQLSGGSDADPLDPQPVDQALASSPRTVEVVSTELIESDDETQAPREATTTLRWTWDLSEYGSEPWIYATQAALTRSGETWTAEWDPTLVHPDLRAGSVLDLTRVEPDRGDIVGAGDTVLVTERPVTRFGIARDQVSKKQAPASARRLATLLDVQPAPFVRQVRDAGPRAFVEALVLRQGDIPIRVGRDYGKIPGALAVQDTVPLAPTADFAAPILGSVGAVTAEMIEEDPSLSAGDVRGISGLQARYDDQLVGTPGLQVTALAADGNGKPVHEQPAVAGEDLVVSLDQQLQAGAEETLAGVGPASALVAVRPSDGAVLAAANGPGAGGVNIATFGQAAPGSTFKIVSSLALLRDGAGPSTRVNCPASTVVNGKRFENYDGYPASGLGRITLGQALANSCNTAFVESAARLAPDAPAAAAASLGLGIDHDLGFPAYLGQVPPPETETEAGADMIGQGGVLASPMSMAVVTASVQGGATVVPWLVDEVRSEVPEEASELTEDEARELKGMLREVVRSGSGAQLADVPGPPILAKTGTAEFDRDGKRLLHAWMVAGQGDLAVAVYVDEGQGGSRTAGPLLENFLRIARR